MKHIGLPGETENLRKAGLWIIGNMQYNVPLSTICAMNEMKNAAAMLRERKDLYRHTLKRHINTALQHAENKRTLLIAYHNDRKAFDEYSDNIVDITEADVTALRDALEAELTTRGVPESGLVAWVEAANLLLHLAVRHYQTVILQGNKKANKDLEERKAIAKAMYSAEPVKLKVVLRQQEIDYNAYFRQMCVADVTDAWNIVATEMNPEVTVLTEGPVMDGVQAISKKYSDGTYINKCIDLMRHHPMFADMQARPEEDSEIQ